MAAAHLTVLKKLRKYLWRGLSELETYSCLKLRKRNWIYNKLYIHVYKCICITKIYITMVYFASLKVCICIINIL